MLLLAGVAVVALLVCWLTGKLGIALSAMTGVFVKALLSRLLISSVSWLVSCAMSWLTLDSIVVAMNSLSCSCIRDM